MIHPAIARSLPRLPREPVACLIDLSTLVEMAAEWTEFRTRTGHRGAYNRKTQKKVYGDEAERVLGAERAKPKDAAPKQRPNARQAFRLADRGFKRHPRGEQLAAQVRPEDIVAMLDYTPPEARR